MIYLQNYVPTVFENYTASFEIDKHRIELNMWDTSGKNCFRFCSTRGDGSLCPLQMDTFAFGLDFSISSRARVCIPSWAVLRVWLALPMLWLLSGTGRGGG